MNATGNNDTATQQSIGATAPLCVWQTEAILGEGILWCPQLKSLLWTDIIGCRLYSYSPYSGAKNTWTLPEPLTCIVPCTTGDYLAVFTSGLYLCSLYSGVDNRLIRNKKLSAIEAELPSNRPNDGGCDYWGNLWFGTMDKDESRASGSFYRYNRATGFNRYRQRVTISNGPVIAPPKSYRYRSVNRSDKCLIYYTDTLQRTIYQATIRANGQQCDARPFCCFSSDDGYPDGMAIDEEYHLWCCLWGSGSIVRISPAGKIVQRIQLPVSHVTK